MDSKLLTLILLAIQLISVIVCLSLNAEQRVASRVSEDINRVAWLAAAYIIISGILLILNFVEAEESKQSWLLPGLITTGCILYLVLGIAFATEAGSVRREKDFGMSTDRYNAFMSYMVFAFIAGIAYGIDAVMQIMDKL